ncbi:MAG: V-type ATPase subunit [Planctomycetota bacterium]|jgi:V/A-type H+-transporting ATPase subunit C
MPKARFEETMFEFLTYPQVGADDWRYTSQSAEVRVMEMQLLTRAVLMDMANAPDFASAVGSLVGGDYAISQANARMEDVEALLLEKRTLVRESFAEWMLDEAVVTLFKSRDDFANLRLALRRVLTDRPVGSDYSADGNAAPDVLEQVFEEENYALFPDYLAEATEQAILAYYQDKKIPQIDHVIDRCEAEYKIAQALELGDVFLMNLFRLQIDLTNIRTVLRLKHLDADQRHVLLPGGFLEADRLREAFDHGYDGLGQLFFATPYHRIVEVGAGYVVSDESFLKVEQQCDEYLTGYLRSTSQITAGPQPIIAYLLLKEHEIRTVRLILTAKKNLLDTKLILDRVGA